MIFDIWRLHSHCTPCLHLICTVIDCLLLPILLVLFVHHVFAVAFHFFLTIRILVLLHLLHGFELTDLFLAQVLNVLAILLLLVLRRLRGRTMEAQA